MKQTAAIWAILKVHSLSQSSILLPKLHLNFDFTSSYTKPFTSTHINVLSPCNVKSSPFSPGKKKFSVPPHLKWCKPEGKELTASNSWAADCSHLTASLQLHLFASQPQGAHPASAFQSPKLMGCLQPTTEASSTSWLNSARFFCSLWVLLHFRLASSSSVHSTETAS